MPKAVSTPTTLDTFKRRMQVRDRVASSRRLPAVPASLEARFVSPAHRIAVTFAKPVEHGRPELVTGNLVGTMHARGAVHHYQVEAAGVLWIVPPVWLVPASALATAAAPSAGAVA